MAVYPIIASICLIPLRMSISENNPVILDSLGMYISLVAVSTLLLSQIGHATMRKRPLFQSTLRSIYTCAGFALVVLFVGGSREIMGLGSFMGTPISFIQTPIYGVSLGFFGFIFLGFMIAILRYIKRAMDRGLIMWANKGEVKE